MSVPDDRAGSRFGDESELLQAIRDGDEQAFAELVRTYNGALLGVAVAHVPSVAVAEEVVQDTWLAVIDGIDRFEGRSSLKTWLFAILVNQSKARGIKEARVSGGELPREDGSSVPADRFQPDEKIFARHWTTANYPVPFGLAPDDTVVMAEAMTVVAAAVRGLPPAQRQVIVLRDMQHLSAGEACDVLGVTEANQRVLLHRARSRVRAALEAYATSPESRPPT